MLRSFVAIGAVMAVLGVAAGAFGAHALRGRVAADLLPIFETAVRYQMYHALAILAIGAMADRLGPQAHWAVWAMVLGVVVFSGSLYLLVLTDTRWLGAVTPVGGLALIVGWILLAVSALR